MTQLGMSHIVIKSDLITFGKDWIESIHLKYELSHLAEIILRCDFGNSFLAICSLIAFAIYRSFSDLLVNTALPKRD